MTSSVEQSVAELTSKQEWRRMWPLPLVAMLGIAGLTSFAFGSGVFISKMTGEFHWSQTDFASGFTVHMLTYLVASIVVGRLVDRVGPRRIVLTGIIPFALAYSALGLANGSVWQWWALCSLLGLCGAGVSSAVWVTGVISRFNSARGGALAVSLAGMGVSNALAPMTAAFLINAIGWRQAFATIAIGWAVLILPLAFLFFKSVGDVATDKRLPARSSSKTENVRPRLAPILWSRAFLFLLFAGGLFSVVAFGMTVHLVSILQSNGFDLTTAATISGVAGAANLVGQIGTGFLLDKLSARHIGIGAFLLPIATAFLLMGHDGSVVASVAAVATFGIAMGAQTDVVAYLASRLMPIDAFGTVYAIMVSIFAVCASFGPLIAATVFDLNNSYQPYLMLVMPIVVVAAGSLAIATMGTSTPEAVPEF